MEQTCFVCKSPAQQTPTENNIQVECLRCDKYYINEAGLEFLQTHKAELISEAVAKISGWIRENKGALITPDIIKRQILLPSPYVGEKAEKLLKYLASKHPTAGEVFQ